MKFLILFSTILITSQAFGLSLLQETKDIACTGTDMKALIEKKDRYVDINGIQFQLVEFLDSAILTQFDDEHAHIQMLPKNQAILTVGQLFHYKENQCRQIGAQKRCCNPDDFLNNKIKKCASFQPELLWGPTNLVLNTSIVPVNHYGVYPNDGTFFIGYEKHSGLVLIDFGLEFAVLSGVSYTLDCQYK